MFIITVKKKKEAKYVFINIIFVYLFLFVVLSIVVCYPTNIINVTIYEDGFVSFSRKNY